MSIATLIPTAAGLFAALSALFSSAGIVCLKLWSGAPTRWLAVLVCGFLGCAAALEALALRNGRLGMTYVMILCCEVLFVAAAAHLGFGERYSLRELVGCGMIIVGASLACC